MRRVPILLMVSSRRCQSVCGSWRTRPFTSGNYLQGGIWGRFRADIVPREIIPAIRPGWTLLPNLMFRCGLLDLAVVSGLEARVGIEPTYKGFADPLLATPNLSDSTQVPITINFGPVFVRGTLNPPAPFPCAVQKNACSTLSRRRAGAATRTLRP